MRSPFIMVAPNGGRLSKRDHPRLPETIAEIVETAVACHAAGAAALHAHVRDANGDHVLDAGLYRELITEMAHAAPAMEVQISTEAVGRYTPSEQMAVVRDVRPKSASFAVREILGDGDEMAVRRFFREAREAGVAVQHIVYEPGEIEVLADLRRRDVLPEGPARLLLVLGKRGGVDATPADLDPFLAALGTSDLAGDARFMACAFGRDEIACLKAAATAGGDCRVGFENNFLSPDGSPLTDNVESVKALVAALPYAP
jgi:3-keto-5-aminohexanoate cleavage enzyme